MSNNVSIYDLEYFSGAQMTMYIGDVLIDEVTSLQVSVQQQKRPIYGYASQLFDKVATGTVLVEGQFTINFKEAGYLNTVLERYKSMSSGSPIPFNSPFMSKDGFSQISKDRSGGAKQFGEKGFLKRQNIEQVSQTNKVVNGVITGEFNGRNVRPEEMIEFYRSLSGFNNNAPARNGTTAGALNPAEDIFERFEDKIWSSDRLDEDSQGRRGDSNKFNDFTIYAVFGDYNSNDGVNHTAKRIDNVHIIGQSQVIQINGEPIGEQYSFFARNFV